MWNVMVFAYGTLKTGLRNNYRFRHNNAKSLGTAYFETSEFVLCSGHSYPYAIRVNKEQFDELIREGVDPVIQGELFEGPESMIDDLDRFEGCPNLFLRQEVVVRADDSGGQSFNAWMYHKNGFLVSKDYVCCDGYWYPELRGVSARQLSSVHDMRV